MPGKTLARILDRPLIAHVMEQVQAAGQLERVVLSTSDQPQDDPLAELAAKQGWPLFRGSADDVLDRFHRTAEAYGFDAVVRITGDCPLKDPEIIDQVAAFHRQHPEFDYIATNFEPRLPLGMDVDLFTAGALERAWREATLPSEREHVNPYMRKHPERFRQHSIVYPHDYSSYRVAVDEPVDLEVVRRVIESLYRPGRVLHLRDVVSFLDQHAEVAGLNAGLLHNEGYVVSLKHDLAAMDIRLPRGLPEREWERHVGRQVAARLDTCGHEVRAERVGEAVAGRVGFAVVLRGAVLDAVDLPEVRVPIEVSVEEAGQNQKAGETASCA